MRYWLMFAVWCGVMLVIKHFAHEIVDNYGLIGTAIALAVIFIVGCVIEGRKQRREANHAPEWTRD